MPFIQFFARDRGREWSRTHFLIQLLQVQVEVPKRGVAGGLHIDKPFIIELICLFTSSFVCLQNFKCLWVFLINLSKSDLMRLLSPSLELSNHILFTLKFKSCIFPATFCTPPHLLLPQKQRKSIKRAKHLGNLRENLGKTKNFFVCLDRDFAFYIFHAWLAHINLQNFTQQAGRSRVYCFSKQKQKNASFF